MKYAFMMGICCWALMACSLSVSPPAGSGRSSGGQSSSREESETQQERVANSSSFQGLKLNVADLSRPPVSASSLQVFSPIVSLEKVGGLWLGNVSFRATGLADYVEITVCAPSSDNKNPIVCENSVRVVTNRYRLKAYPEGKVVVKLRACVFPERAKESGKVCGEENRTEFYQRVHPNVALMHLTEKREQYRRDLQAEVVKMQEVLKNFEKESEECQKREAQAEKIEAIRGIVANFLTLGEELLKKAFDPPSTGESAASEGSDSENAENNQEDGGSGKDPVGEAAAQALGLAADQASQEQLVVGPEVQKIADPLEEYNKKLQRFQEFDSTVRQVATSLGFFAESQPVNAIKTLGMAIFDLFTAKKQVKVECLAKDKADRAIEAIKTRIDSLKQLIAQIDSQIKEEK